MEELAEQQRLRESRLPALSSTLLCWRPQFGVKAPPKGVEITFCTHFLHVSIS